MNRVLVIAPHPDDETLGCGGTILKHKSDGYEVHWLIMTTLEESGGISKEKINERSKQIELVTKLYGFDSVEQLPFTTTKLDNYPIIEVIQCISAAIQKIKPNTLYVPFRADIHTDHAIVFDAAMACTKSFRYPSIKSVRVYETLSETEFNIIPGKPTFKPNLWNDISAYLEEKIKIMKSYEGEIAGHPFPRSEKNIRALATLRGGTVNVDAAESFIIIKEIN